MPIFSRFRYTAATIGRSDGCAVSFSTSDASVTASRGVNSSACAACCISAVKSCLKRPTIRPTSFAAVVSRGTEYVSGNR